MRQPEILGYAMLFPSAVLKVTDGLTDAVIPFAEVMVPGEVFQKHARRERQLGNGAAMGGGDLAQAVQALTAQNAQLVARLAAIEANTAAGAEMARQFDSYTNGGTFSRQKAMA